MAICSTRIIYVVDYVVVLYLAYEKDDIVDLSVLEPWQERMVDRDWLTDINLDVRYVCKEVFNFISMAVVYNISKAVLSTVSCCCIFTTTAVCKRRNSKENCLSLSQINYQHDDFSNKAINRYFVI